MLYSIISKENAENSVSSIRIIFKAAESWLRTTCSVMDSFSAISAIERFCSLFISKISLWRGESFVFACCKAFSN